MPFTRAQCDLLLLLVCSVMPAVKKTALIHDFADRKFSRDAAAERDGCGTFKQRGLKSQCFSIVRCHWLLVYCISIVQFHWLQSNLESRAPLKSHRTVHVPVGFLRCKFNASMSLPVTSVFVRRKKKAVIIANVLNTESSP